MKNFGKDISQHEKVGVVFGLQLSVRVYILADDPKNNRILLSLSREIKYDCSNKNPMFLNLAGSKNGRKIGDENFQVNFQSNPSLQSSFAPSSTYSIVISITKLGSN